MPLVKEVGDGRAEIAERRHAEARLEAAMDLEGGELAGPPALAPRSAPLIVADLMRGTGRYNLALGAVATLQGIGASLSGLAAGLIVDRFGYEAAFLGAGAVAGIALLLLAVAMPETAGPLSSSRSMAGAAAAAVTP